MYYLLIALYFIILQSLNYSIFCSSFLFHYIILFFSSLLLSNCNSCQCFVEQDDGQDQQQVEDTQEEADAGHLEFKENNLSKVHTMMVQIAPGVNM